MIWGVENLAVHFGKVKALNSVAIELERGGVHAVVGGDDALQGDQTADRGAEGLDDTLAGLHDLAVLDDYTFGDFAAAHLPAGARHDTAWHAGEPNVHVKRVLESVDEFLDDRLVDLLNVVIEINLILDLVHQQAGAAEAPLELVLGVDSIRRKAIFSGLFAGIPGQIFLHLSVSFN